MSERFTVNRDIEDSTFCCGLKEVGGLGFIKVEPTITNNWKGQVQPNPYYNRAAKTPHEAWETMLKEARDDYLGYPLMFNLVVGNGNTADLRTLLNEQEDCYHVHTWKNPNSGNVLEMYVLTNGSSENFEMEEEDDSDF